MDERNNPIGKLFLENSNFVLIGLTGRTGSGCTTAADFLESSKPIFPDSHWLKDFYIGLDLRRYEILKKYAESNWSEFYSIKVSDLISGYIIQNSVNRLSEFIVESDNSVDIKSIQKLLRKGIFSKKNRVTYATIGILEKLLNHEDKFNLSDRELKYFIRSLIQIRRFTRDFKKELDSIKHGLYISTYQHAGKSIRKIGRVFPGYQNCDFVPEAVFHLPETINRVIKSIRKQSSGACRIVIDAIRNPHEVKYLRDRFSSFNLISVNTPDEDRIKYLESAHKFSKDKLRDIEVIESGKSVSIYDEFTTQNVKRCIEISDIHIFNPRNESGNNNILNAQLIWYLSLMMHPGLVPPTSMERVMQIAFSAKINSGCISRQVGAVVTDSDNSIKAVGWNDVAKGQTPCSLRSFEGLLSSFSSKDYSQFELNDADFRDAARQKSIEYTSKSEVFKGRSIPYCFKDIKNEIDHKGNQVHTRSLHAEENAFLQITKYGGQGVEGGKLYTTASPCELCAKKAYQLGIAEVIFIDPYPGIAISHVLRIGDRAPALTQFRGAVGRAYHRLYEQSLPLKDEFKYLLQ